MDHRCQPSLYYNGSKHIWNGLNVVFVKLCHFHLPKFLQQPKYFSGFDSTADPFRKRTLVLSILSEKVISIHPVSKPPPSAPRTPSSPFTMFSVLSAISVRCFKKFTETQKEERRNHSRSRWLYLMGLNHFWQRSCKKLIHLSPQILSGHKC